MDPNQQPQPQPQPNLSVDYLNQIAPQAPKRKIPLSKTQLIIFGVLGVLFIVVMILVAVVGGGGTKPLQQLAARLQSTETIVTDAASKIKSSQMRALNSNLKIYLTNTNRDIAAPLAAVGVDVGKLDEDVMTKEAGTDVTDRLENARLNATYDRTYAGEIAHRLETIVILMRQIQTSTSNQSLKTFLTDALTNLEPTQKDFADFNAANS